MLPIRVVFGPRLKSSQKRKQPMLRIVFFCGFLPFRNLTVSPSGLELPKKQCQFLFCIWLFQPPRLVFFFKVIKPPTPNPKFVSRHPELSYNGFAPRWCHSPSLGIPRPGTGPRHQVCRHRPGREVESVERGDPTNHKIMAILWSYAYLVGG